MLSVLAVGLKSNNAAFDASGTNTFETIAGATFATYTPTTDAEDDGQFLRVTATYTDATSAAEDDPPLTKTKAIAPEHGDGDDRKRGVRRAGGEGGPRVSRGVHHERGVGVCNRPGTSSATR